MANPAWHAADIEFTASLTERLAMRLPTVDQIQTVAHRSPDPLNIKGRFCDVMGIPADDPAAVVPHGRNWRVLGMWGDQPADKRQVIVVAYGVDKDIYRCCRVADLTNLY